MSSQVQRSNRYQGDSTRRNSDEINDDQIPFGFDSDEENFLHLTIMHNRQNGSDNEEFSFLSEQNQEYEDFETDGCFDPTLMLDSDHDESDSGEYQREESEDNLSAAENCDSSRQSNQSNAQQQMNRQEGKTKEQLQKEARENLYKLVNGSDLSESCDEEESQDEEAKQIQRVGGIENMLAPQERNSEYDNFNIFPTFTNIRMKQSKGRSIMTPASKKFKNTKHYIQVMLNQLKEEYFGPFREAISHILLTNKIFKNDLRFNDSKYYIWDYEINKSSLQFHQNNQLLVNIRIITTVQNTFDSGIEDESNFKQNGLVCFLNKITGYWILGIVASQLDQKNEGEALFEENKRIQLAIYCDPTNIIEVLKELSDPNFKDNHLLVEPREYWYPYELALKNLSRLNRLNAEDKIRLSFEKEIMQRSQEPIKPHYRQFDTERFEPIEERPQQVEGRRNNRERQKPKPKVPIKNNPIFSSSQTQSKEYFHRIKELIGQQRDFDPIQLECLTYMLTNNIAVVQGPPGTGKSFLCDRALQILHQTYGLEEGRSPILVVCSRNETVDQFIKNYIKRPDQKNEFTRQQTIQLKDIVRLGNMSKNEEIKEFEVPSSVYNGSFTKNCKNTIDELNQILDQLRDVSHSQIHLTFDDVIQLEKTFHEYNLKGFRGDYEVGRANQFGKLICQHFFQELCKSGSNIEEIVEKLDVEDKEIILENWTTISFTNKIIDDIFKRNNLQLAQSKKDRYLMFQAEVAEALNQGSLERKRNNLLQLKMPWYESMNQTKSEDHLEFEEEGLLDSYNYEMPLGKNASEQHSLVLEAKKLTDFGDGIITNLINFVQLIKKVNLLKNFQTKYFEILRNEKERKENRSRQLCGYLRRKHLVVMTLAGSHKYFQALKLLKPEIIFMDEAAETVENNMVHLLALRPKHLIQVGDHYQLEPKVSNQFLKMIQKFGSSQFKRLTETGFNFKQLKTQWRMTKGLADFVRIFYDNKYFDSPKAHEKEDLFGGEQKEIQFIPHTFPENQIPNSTYTVNSFEAFFCVKFAERLIVLHGIKAENITILTFYRGQKYYILENMNKVECQHIHDIKVSTVDGYQGQENDVIILSCVRSNWSMTAGFLLLENRINVGLSRARRAAFIVGNFQQLYKQDSPAWKKVIELAIENSYYLKKVDRDFMKRYTEKFNKLRYKKEKYLGCTVCVGEPHIGDCVLRNVDSQGIGITKPTFASAFQREIGYGILYKKDQQEFQN